MAQIAGRSRDRSNKIKIQNQSRRPFQRLLALAKSEQNFHAIHLLYDPFADTWAVGTELLRLLLKRGERQRDMEPVD